MNNEDPVRIRYLTPRECLRLMGFYDSDIDKLEQAVPAKTNLYKLAGNSIVVNCLEEIFKGMYLDKTYESKRLMQKSIVDFD